MTSSFLKNKGNKQKGAATLIISTLLLVTLTLIILFAASYNIMQEKITANQSRSNQAFEAAEAGLEFGIQYLQQNSAVILASPVLGFIPAYSNSSTTNVTLANNSRYTIVYTNPIANNYRLIEITSTGTNADGSSTRVVRQQVQFGSLLMNPPTNSLTSKGSITLGGHGTVTNIESNNTIQSASTITIGGSGSTVTIGGGSVAGAIGSDIQQNISSINSQSQTDFFATYFGASRSTVKNNAAHYYNSSSNSNYSSTLNGMTGTSIWIDQTAGTTTLNGGVVIGSLSNPVLVVVNGPLNLSGNVTIYGLIFVIGSTGITNITGNILITGGMITTDDFNMSGNSNLVYSSSVLNKLQNSTSMSYYAKVPGSWKNF